MTSYPKGLLFVPVWCDDGIIKAIVDANGRIPVSLGASGITVDVNLKTSDITLPTAEQTPLTNIQARQYGYVNSAWKSAGLPLNYELRIKEVASFTATSTASYQLDCSSPSAGKLWVVQSFTSRNMDKVTEQRFVINAASSNYFVGIKIPTAVNEIVVCEATPFVITEDDACGVIFISPTIGDRFRVYLWGYQIDL